MTTPERIAAAVPVVQWNHCYDSSWKGLITPESFSHPAKFSRDLIEHILDHCLEQSYLQRGDVVGDCFAGIGTGGIAAAYRGLRWVGVELEPRFVSLAQANFELHRSKWETLGVPLPQIIQGDSRAFHKVVQANAVVTSPPFGDVTASAGDPNYAWKFNGEQDYGQTPGQIGQLKAGNVDAVVASPPFSGPNMQPRIGQGARNELAKDGKSPECGTVHDRAPGNIETLKEGSVDGVVSRPPFEDKGAFKPSKGVQAAQLANGKWIPGGSEFATGYGTSPGQIGREKGETYWQAVDAVYRSCWLAIKPGGVIVLVVKDYVKAGRRVPLCDDTARLLEHIGFEIVERVHAMLVKETRHNDLFEGTTTRKTERKSFFRRIHEKKPGAVKIDWEEVIICRKP